jgi:hypothetical protein
MQDHERLACGERLDDRAVAAVRDDDVGERQHVAMRRGCHDDHVLGRGNRLRRHGRPRRHEPAHRQAAECGGDPLQAVHVVLERRRHGDDHERRVARREAPVRGIRPRRIVEDRPDVPRVVGEGGREVEGRRREHELAAGGAHLLPERRDGIESVRRADPVEVAQRVPIDEGRARPAHSGVTGAPERTTGGPQAGAERRHAVGGQHVDVRHEQVEGHVARLGRDHRAESEARRDHEVGFELVDRGAGLVGLRGGCADEHVLGHATGLRHRAAQLPVAELRAPSRPRAHLGAGVFDRARHGVVGDDDDAMPAVDDPPHDADLGRHGATGIRQREQVGARRVRSHRRSPSRVGCRRAYRHAGVVCIGGNPDRRARTQRRRARQPVAASRARA